MLILSHELSAFRVAIVIFSRVGRLCNLPRLDLIRAEKVSDDVVSSAHVWRQLEGLQVDETLCLDEVKVVLGVVVLLVWFLIEE